MKVGLALSGGVVRGAAHLGVLDVLVEAQIPIDYIAGASAGSIVGSLYAAGKTTDDMRQFMKETGWFKLARLTLNSRGFVSFAPMEKLINQYLDHAQFENLQTPCSIVTTDMSQGVPYVFDSGSVAQAVRASSSIPGFVTPVELNGRLLCDGGASNNCPVDVLRDMGAEYVIAVDIFSPSKPKFGSIGMMITALETMIRQSGGGINQADCLITPDLSGKSYFRFSKIEEYIDLGKQATLPLIDKIKKDIR